MSEEQPKCPVDHSTREAWLKQGKSSPHPIHHDNTTNTNHDDSITKCPVDHEAQAKWSQLSKQQITHIDGSSIPTEVEIPQSSASHSSEGLNNEPIYTTNSHLPDDRSISSIPRTGTQSNWIYPSQKQFFEAMKRKNWNPNETDMETVVPIHNAVNERTWNEILKWEDKKGSEACGGVQLTSFKGDSKKLTPKARFFSLLGYSKPFDRHDWTINRCGVEIDYVIDFYTGRVNPNFPQMASFYLDVRPKLNSFEGVKMRILGLFGL